MKRDGHEDRGIETEENEPASREREREREREAGGWGRGAYGGKKIMEECGNKNREDREVEAKRGIERTAIRG